MDNLLLEQLTSLYNEREKDRSEYDTQRNLAVPAEIRETLRIIDENFEEKSARTNKQISELEERIKLMVMNQQETVRSSGLIAVYNKGRVSWNSKGLDGFMVAHPEIEAFRKEGNPYVSIRKTKK